MAAPETDDGEDPAVAAEVEEEEAVPEQFECSICMKLLVEPVTVACGHTFCRSCLEQSLGYRSVCAVCRAPITSGQGVNVLIKSLIATQYPRALRQRLQEQDEEMRRAEQEAEEARQRDVQSAEGEEGNGLILPILLLPTSSLPSPPPMPHCKVVHEFASEEVRSLVQFALEGGRRLGIVESTGEFDENARPVGVCLDIQNVVRGLPGDRPWSIHLSGRYRFRLLEPTQPHENGFQLGRCEAFFDLPTPVSQLMATHEADDNAEETLPELAQSALRLMEEQLQTVGADGRRAFQQRHGDIPGAPGTGAGTQMTGTSASMERLSFWLHRSMLCSKDEWRTCLETTDTRARLRHCRDKLQAAGRRPMLDLPGATSLMHQPGQSALGSLALLVVILAILVAKAMGFLDAVTSYGTGRQSNYAQNVAAVHDAAVFFQFFR